MRIETGISRSPNGAIRRDAVAALLGDESLTFTEIGRRVGLTRERVRQIAELAGVTGKTRMAARWKPKPPLPNRTAELVLISAGNAGLKAEPSGRASVVVNGLPCFTASACWYTQVNKTKYGTYRTRCLNFKLPRRAVEGNYGFLLVTSRIGIFVMPRAAWPKGSARFVPDRDPKFGCHSNRHDYMEYLDAWHLIAEAQ